MTLEAPSAVVSLVSFRNESLSRREADVHLCDTVWRCLLCDPGYYWLWRVHSDCVSCFCVQFVSCFNMSVSSVHKPAPETNACPSLDWTESWPRPPSNTWEMTWILDPGWTLKTDSSITYRCNVQFVRAADRLAFLSFYQLRTSCLSLFFTSLSLSTCLSLPLIGLSTLLSPWLPVCLYRFFNPPVCLPAHLSTGRTSFLTNKIKIPPQNK